MGTPAAQNGFLVITGSGTKVDPETILSRELPDVLVHVTQGVGWTLWQWGDSHPVVVSDMSRSMVPGTTLERAVDSVCCRVDWLAFQQVYLRQASGWAAASTSSAIMARLEPVGIDREAMANLATLGWFVGRRTAYDGIRVMQPGASVVLKAGKLSERAPKQARGEDMPLAEAVPQMVQSLRDSMAVALSAAPDPVLQLTGGVDSRILLAAVPPPARSGLRAMTLAVPGSEDVPIAAGLAARWGLRHEVHDAVANGLERDPGDWLRACRASARSLGAAADPLARTAIETVESRIGPQRRVAGLGGEVMRGFYYVGYPLDARITRRRVERLAAWRLFSNGSAPLEMLSETFRREVRRLSVDTVESELHSTGESWGRATDDFYLWSRMGRWAGSIASAQPATRPTVNPMLSQPLLALARRVHPREKRDMRLLASLLTALDPDLAALPLDGRPAPAAYLADDWTRRRMTYSVRGRALLRKSSQRIRGRRRAPVGGLQLTEQLRLVLRDSPNELVGGVELGLVDPQWYAGLSTGAGLTPSAAALLVNLDEVFRVVH